MDAFSIVAVLVVLAALFSFINYRFIRLPTTIGVMLTALVVSLGLVLLERFGVPLRDHAERLLDRVDFDRAVLHGMLGFLLFAGALHIDLNDLIEHKWTIGVLATVGLFVSTCLIGTATWFVAGLLGTVVPVGYCFLFGALISPTDPIAVLAMLKKAGAARSLEVRIAGESLFNDGVAVVAFLLLSAVAAGEQSVTTGDIIVLFLEEVLGGVALGLAAGWISYQLLKRVDEYQVEVLLTLALVMGGYAAADALGASGPIAMVVAGLLIGNHGRRFAMSEQTRKHLDMFWELLDGILNAVLFVLIGLEVLVMPARPSYLLAGLLAVPIVLAARFVSVGGTIGLLRFRRRFGTGALATMTWGGLRGGISVALALSLPDGPHRPILVVATYVVVLFSVLVQGSTMAGLIRRYSSPARAGAVPA